MRGGKRSRLSEEKIAMIRELYEQNKTYKEIAEIVGCSMTAAWVYSQRPENLERYRESHRRWYIRTRSVEWIL